jgi:cell division protease FtsH
MKKILAFLTNKITVFSIVIISFAVIINSSSTVNKQDNEESLNKDNLVLSDLALMKHKIGMVKILKYPTMDVFYITFGETKSVIQKNVTLKRSSDLLKTIIIPENIPYTIIKSNISDMFLFYVYYPAKDLLSSIFDKAIIIVPLIFFIILIYFLYKKGSSEGKYEVIWPSSIVGDSSDLIGMDDLKKIVAPLIKKNKSRSNSKSYNVSKTFNILMSGPPGTGKTRFASYFAKEMGLPLLCGSASSLETGLVGGGSSSLESLYKEAKKLKKVVIFLDEAQVLLASRNNTSVYDTKHKDDTVNTLLSILDGVKTSDESEIYWMLASNFNDNDTSMDTAVLRRFKIKLDFRLPNKGERGDIFRKYIGKIDPVCVGWVDFDYLAEISSGLSPAHIEGIVDAASVLCSGDNSIISTTVLYDSFERSCIGISNRENTLHAEGAREVVAIHELGHFIVEFDHLMEKYNGDINIVKNKLSVLKISTESVSKIGALGYVLSKTSDVSLDSLHNLEVKIKKLYGGVAAEKVFFGERAVTIGSGNDIQKATEILRKMVFELGIYSNSKVNYLMIGNESKNNELVKILELKSEELFAQTEGVIQRNIGLINYMNSALLKNYVLQTEEINGLLSSYYYELEKEETEVGNV